MSTWTELRATLLRVVDEHPDALHVYPGPSTVARHDEPWEIHLAAWALDVAADLHERFGDAVELKVGAMHYPQQRLRRPPPSLKELLPAESYGIRTRLPRPLAIASGHGVRCEVVIGNGTSDRVVLSATGGLLGSVVTDDEGEVSAEDTGPTQSSLVTFAVEPHTGAGRADMGRHRESSPGARVRPPRGAMVARRLPRCRRDGDAAVLGDAVHDHALRIW